MHAVLLFACLATVTHSCTHHTFTADSWAAPTGQCKGQECNNVIPFFWLRWDHSPGHSHPNLTKLVETAAAALRNQSYHTGLFDWSLHRAVADDPKDNILPPNSACAGTRHANYSGLWWDNGAQEVKNRFTLLFQEWQKMKAPKVDRFVLDSETWMSNWVIENPSVPLPCQKAMYEAISNDKRWPPIFKKMKALGFSQPNGQSLYKAMRVVDNYKIFDAIVRNRVSMYFKEAMFEPVQSTFPQISYTDYGFVYDKLGHCIPDYNGYEVCKYSPGSVYCNVQSESLYFSFANPGLQNALDKLYPNVGKFENTTFNIFRFTVMKVRSSIGSSPSTPYRPWFAYKSWSNSSLAKRPQLYTEAVFHALLSGSQDLNYWNPTRLSTEALIHHPHWRGTPSEEEDHPSKHSEDDYVLSEALKESTRVAGCEERVAEEKGVMNFTEPFVLSAMTLTPNDPNNRTAVLRWTPDTPTPALKSVTVYKDHIVLKASNSKMQCTITAPGGKVIGHSMEGVWISQQSGYNIKKDCTAL